ncbi:MAG TPA: metallophosphoesterase [Verrucomicrobiae bacterium]|nr:metallophosphoesterase [Verrucomicrobiae bacterium]
MRSFRFGFIVLPLAWTWLLAANAAPPEQLSLVSRGRDLTFIVVSDTHYGLGGEEGARTIPLLVDKMNALPGTAYPTNLGGTVGRPKGVIHLGDITNDGKPEQWAMFVRDYGLTGKDGRLAYPVYETFGNHDGGPRSPVREGIRERNRHRIGVTTISTNGLHYGWTWDGIQFVALGVAPGSTTHPYDPEYSMEFLERVLPHATKGEPLILLHHFGFDPHSLGWWSEERRDQYYDLIKGENVLAIIHGHAHEPLIYQWRGLDVYHPPHFRQKVPKGGPKNTGPVTHGFFVFHITDTELTVAERRLDDTWGMTSRKSLPRGPAVNAPPKATTSGAELPSEQVLTIDLAAAGKMIGNKFSDLNMWSVDQTWTQEASARPGNYFASNFPFVQRVQLMAATGGNGQRDLFKDPNDRRTLTDYDFSPLIKACEGILAHGLKPMIKTGWVPLKMSTPPRLGAFGTNVRPPDDYAAYGAYIRALCQALKERFGVDELRQWSWGVGVEFENRDWFAAQDETPESTKQAYFRLYDETVAGLEEVLGARNVTVGAHGMVVSRGWWDPRDFIEHCATGENLQHGGKGTHLDFVGVSYYTGEPGFDPALFVKTVHAIRDKANELGLKRLRIGMDEGRVLNGWDGRVLYPREVEHPIQAAGDARLFHLMVDEDVDYCSTWCLTTAGIFGGIPVVSANLRNLAFRMAGSVTVNVQSSGPTVAGADRVMCLAGYEQPTQTLRVLLYNFDRDRTGRGPGKVRLALNHARLPQPDAVHLSAWRLDETNGNWWSAWEADAAARGLAADAYRASAWTLYLPGELVRPADVQFWNSRRPAYEARARMDCTRHALSPGRGGELFWDAELNPNTVLLYEIAPIEKATL